MSCIRVSILASIFCYSGVLLAQTLEPALLTTIRIEDAAGNVDSVEVGWDDEADSPIEGPPFSTQFGEVDIEAPWDSIFEVRTAHTTGGVFTPPEWLSKRFVGKARLAEGSKDCWINRSGAFVYIRAVNWPITISWDPSFFSRSECSMVSVLVTDLAYELYDATNGTYWHDLQDMTYACMADTSQYTIDLANDFFYFGNYDAFIDEIESPVSKQDTIYGVLIAPHQQSDPYSPCQSLYVATEEAPSPENESSAFRVVPNPTGGEVRLLYADPERARSVREVRLFDAAGRSLRRFDRPVDRLDLGDLPPGVYTLAVRFRDGSRAVRRVVVSP